jgi:hypothetical protein
MFLLQKVDADAAYWWIVHMRNRTSDHGHSEKSVRRGFAPTSARRHPDTIRR